VVEVAPAYDGVGEQTALAAAQVVFEVVTSLVEWGIGENERERERERKEGGEEGRRADGDGLKGGEVKEVEVEDEVKEDGVNARVKDEKAKDEL